MRFQNRHLQEFRSFPRVLQDLLTKPTLSHQCIQPTPHPISPPDVPGTRLTRVYLTSADGFERLVAHGVHDVGIGEDCAFAPDASGALRCYPPPLLQLAFLDQACTQPIAYADATSANHVRMATTPTGANVVVTLGAAVVPAPAAAYRLDIKGACLAAGTSGIPHAVVATADESSLVASTVSRRPITPTIDAVIHSGSDGSVLFLGELYDRLHDAPHRLPV